MYKQDLGLHNQQELICRKKKLNYVKWLSVENDVWYKYIENTFIHSMRKQN